LFKQGLWKIPSL